MREYSQWWKRMEQQMRAYVGTDPATGEPREGLRLDDPVEVLMFGKWIRGTVRTMEEGRAFTWASDDGRYSAVTVDRVEYWRQPVNAGDEGSAA